MLPERDLEGGRSRHSADQTHQRAGVTCGITDINGHFNAALGDWGDAVYLTASGNQFLLNMANGKRGWAGCMK